MSGYQLTRSNGIYSNSTRSQYNPFTATTTSNTNNNNNDNSSLCHNNTTQTSPTRKSITTPETSSRRAIRAQYSKPSQMKYTPFAANCNNIGKDPLQLYVWGSTDGIYLGSQSYIYNLHSDMTFKSPVVPLMPVSFGSGLIKVDEYEDGIPKKWKHMGAFIQTKRPYQVSKHLYLINQIDQDEFTFISIPSLLLNSVGLDVLDSDAQHRIKTQLQWQTVDDGDWKDTTLPDADDDSCKMKVKHGGSRSFYEV